MAALTELVRVEWELPSTGKSSTTGYALSIAVSSFSQRMTERVCHVYKIGEVPAPGSEGGSVVQNDARSYVIKPTYAANATAHGVGMLFSIAPSAAGPTY